MIIELPDIKIKKTLNLINKFSKTRMCKIRDFAAFIGTLGSQCPALTYSRVYMKGFERDRLLALERHKNNFDAHMVISKSSEEDFNW